RFALASAEQANAIVDSLPADMQWSRPHRVLYRDLYLDTAEDTLRRRGMVCRLRLGSDDRRYLMLEVGGGNGAMAAQRTVERVRATGVIGALAENSSPARRLRAVADPASLIVRLELEVDRLTMAGDPDWLRRSRTIVQSDEITLRGPGAGSLRQICVRSIRGRGDSLARISDLLRRQHGLAPGAPHPREWAEMRRKWMH